MRSAPVVIDQGGSPSIASKQAVAEEATTTVAKTKGPVVHAAAVPKSRGEVVQTSAEQTDDVAPEVKPPEVQEAEHAANAESVYSLDLATALQLTHGEGLQAAIAREQIRQAYARREAADSLWLPSIRAGLNYNKHEGVIQDVAGSPIVASRGSFYNGLGAGAVGAGSPSAPGLSARFQVADAMFEPLAARQAARAQEFAASSEANDALLTTAVAYQELLRACAELAIAEETLDNARRLSKLTDAFAASGEGHAADAQRALAETAVRQIDVERAREARSVASARLAQYLRLDQSVQLSPLEPQPAPLRLDAAEQPLGDLIAQALLRRPDLAEQSLLVREAASRLRKEEIRPLVPSVLLGASYGGFGAGTGGDVGGYGERFDFDAMAYWEVRNLGFGERAAREEMRSRMQQACLKKMALMDQVAREVTEARARIASRERQIEFARAGISAAEASYKQNLQRVEGAVGLPIEALQSMQALAQARREYLRAVADYNIAQFQLQNALGWRVGEESSPAIERPID